MRPDGIGDRARSGEGTKSRKTVTAGVEPLRNGRKRRGEADNSLPDKDFGCDSRPDENRSIGSWTGYPRGTGARFESRFRGRRTSPERRRSGERRLAASRSRPPLPDLLHRSLTEVLAALQSATELRFGLRGVPRKSALPRFCSMRIASGYGRTARDVGAWGGSGRRPRIDHPRVTTKGTVRA